MGLRNFSKKQLSSLAGLSLATILVVSVLSIIPTEDNEYIIGQNAEAISGGGFDVVMMSSSFTAPVILQKFDGSGNQQDDEVQCLVTYTVGHAFTDTSGTGDTVTIKFIFKDANGNTRTQTIVQDYVLAGGLVTTIIDGLFGGFFGIGGGGGNTITVPVLISGVSGSENIIVEAKLSGGTTFLWTLRNPPCLVA